jgi:hypothetical protein
LYKVVPHSGLYVASTFITPQLLDLWFMVIITIGNGCYHPTNITGGHHLVTPTKTHNGFRSENGGCSISIEESMAIFTEDLEVAV